MEIKGTLSLPKQEPRPITQSCGVPRSKDRVLRDGMDACLAQALVEIGCAPGT